MRFVAIERLIKISVLFLSLIAARQTFGQTGKCLTAAEAQKAINLLDSTQNISENKTLRLELLNMQEARRKLDEKIVNNFDDNKKLIPAAYELGEKNLRRLCEIVKQSGWTSRKSVGEDGAAAALSIIKNTKAVDLQREIFPVIAAAVKNGDVGKDQIAALIDIIRVASNLPQIFGTQTNLKDDIFYLAPLQNEAKVDEWRKLYDLPPLDDFIKYVQSEYQTIVLKSPRQIISRPAKSKPTASTGTNAVAVNPLADLEKEEIVKIESSLVNLNVRVSADDPAANDFTLQKDDFAVYEDGKKQDISFFSSSAAPFDLILLLDLSGSTSGKQNLIRKSTRQFIEAARPADRIAIVTFTGEAKIVADLTQNREELLKSVKNIDDRGGSAVWGSLRFVYEKIIKNQSVKRRTAVLLMTDGVDSSLSRGYPLPDSYPTFTELLETVKTSDPTVIPIYLDTESQSNSYEKKAYRTARKTLEMLADASGGQMFYAKKVSDLSGIYEKIINDLGKVYSLGYEPSTDGASGSFRRLTIKLPNHPNLSVHAKQGYYAK